MGDPEIAHRRSRAWEVRYVSRLNVCYWKQVLANRESRVLKIRVTCPSLAFVLTVGFAVGAGTWNPAIIAASIGAAGSLGGILLTNGPVHRFRNYCRQWSELAHDADRLWKEGENLGWDKDNAVAQIERLDTRIRAYQSNELENPDDLLLEECQRKLYRELGQPFPS